MRKREDKTDRQTRRCAPWSATEKFCTWPQRKATLYPLKPIWATCNVTSLKIPNGFRGYIIAFAFISGSGSSANFAAGRRLATQIWWTWIGHTAWKQVRRWIKYSKTVGIRSTVRNEFQETSVGTWKPQTRPVVRWDASFLYLWIATLTDSTRIYDVPSVTLFICKKTLSWRNFFRQKFRIASYYIGTH
jgi:hypothetical protein